MSSWSDHLLPMALADRTDRFVTPASKLMRRAMIPQAVTQGNQSGQVSLAEQLNRPLRMRNRTIPNRLFLAPLASIGHVAFRRLVTGYGGCGLLFSEMCGARSPNLQGKGLLNPSTWRESELCSLVCQLFHNDPEDMATAAKRLEDRGFFGVDINFGCSVQRICRRNFGAALLKNPVLAERIVATIRKAVRFPVFVKFRTGWRDDPGPAISLARRFEMAGADGLVFHPRVAPDRRNRPPRWEYIGLVKAAVSIPVFGNGNVFSRGECLDMLTTTGCDGVSLGRLAIARPWIFAEWTGAHATSPEVYREAPLKLLDLMVEHFDTQTALRRFRKFAAYYAANFRFGHALFNRLRSAPTPDAIRLVLEQFFETPPDILSRPNISLMR